MTRLLIEGYHTIYVAIYSVPVIYGIECLSIVRAQAEIVDVFCKTVDIIVLLQDS